MTMAMDELEKVTEVGQARGLIPILQRRLTDDVRASIRGLSRKDVRTLVDLYYQFQNHRKAYQEQERSAEKAGESTEVLAWFFQQDRLLEAQIKIAMDIWSDNHPVGVWSKEVFGIAEVISAGLLAHVDPERTTNPSKLWRYAGLDPTVIWQSKEKMRAWIGDREVNEVLVLEAAQHFGRKYESLLRFTITTAKGEPRPLNAENLSKALARIPYNKKLKVLCWKIGDCFCKFSNNPKCKYGHLYRERKLLLVAKNDSGGFAELAAHTLKIKKFSDRDTRLRYESGRLPDGRIDLQARNYATKIFLVHWWEQMYRHHFKKEPPQPYAIARLGHADKIES